MLTGYMRISKADGSQVLDLQKDALLAAGVAEGHIYEDMCSGSKDDRPGLAACLKSLRKDDVLVIWRLDRLGRDLIRERTVAGLAAARARGRKGGRPPVFTASKLRRAQAAMQYRDTNVGDLCKEIGVSRGALYRYVTPTGGLTEEGEKLLGKMTR
jgi:DNA invertase Pin-like site-specific DNA recombinase